MKIVLLLLKNSVMLKRTDTDIFVANYTFWDLSKKSVDESKGLRQGRLEFNHLSCLRRLSPFEALEIKKYHLQYVVRCVIWYHLYNFKKMENTHGGVLILVK